MLGCPLATHSETLWLTTDNEHYWRRMSFAMILSIGFHALVIAAFVLYFVFNAPTLSVMLNSGSYDLPINVKIITENSVAQKKTERHTPADPKPVIDTVESTQKTVEEKQPSQEKKPTESQNSHNALNSTASTTQKSEVIGMSEAVAVTSEPRYRVPPQAPEYPAQAQRRRQQGVVMLDITVESNGRTSNVSVQRSSGFSILDAAAVKAANKWEIMPYEVNGQAIRATFKVPVKFELQ